MIRFLNALGRLVMGDRNPGVSAKINPLDIHTLNGAIVINGVHYSPAEAWAIVLEITKRLK